MSAVPFHLVTVVWGRAYTRTYLELILPTQLSPGNLPALRGQSRNCYFVYTTTEDAAVIRRDAGFQQISAMMDARIIEFAPTAENLGFPTMIRHHREAAIAACVAGAAFVALSPDAIFSDGSFAVLRKLQQSGKRLVLLPGLRATLEPFEVALRAKLPVATNGARTIPPRALMGLALDHLHPLSQSLFWEDTTMPTSEPSHVYWWERTEAPKAVLAHCFHLHPLLIYATSKDAAPKSSIDDDYVQTACPDPATHHIVTDSDEIACVELSRIVPRADLTVLETDKVTHVARWCARSCNRTHLKAATQAIYLHDGPTPAPASPTALKAREIVARIRRAVPAAKVRRFFLLLKNSLSAKAHSLTITVARWRGWFLETDWQHDKILPHSRREADGSTQCLLNACWPFDLIVLNGNVAGDAPLRIRLQLTGRPPVERQWPAGDFRWTIPAIFSAGPALNIRVIPETESHRLHINRLVVWRAPVHHLRHTYSSTRPEPVWLEWTGEVANGRIHGPCQARILSPWGVKQVLLTVRPPSGGTGSPQTVSLKIDSAANNSATVALPAVAELQSVSCEVTPGWRIFQEFAQTLNYLAVAIARPLTRALLTK